MQNQQTLISQIEEVGADVGEPDCKLINPFWLIASQDTISFSPWLAGFTKQDNFMISSDKILTLADPTPTLIEKYEELIKE